MEQDSLYRLNQLHPACREKAIAAYLESVRATPKGVHPYITETLRTFKRSDALFNQPHDHIDNDGDGRIDEADERVTNAPGGFSPHNYGLGIDFVIILNGKENWIVDKNWMTVVNIYKRYGFKWGGEFKTIYDAPHFEMLFGYTVRELLVRYKAGKIDAAGYVLL